VPEPKVAAKRKKQRAKPRTKRSAVIVPFARRAVNDN
jgi:hypothetical protein